MQRIQTVKPRLEAKVGRVIKESAGLLVTLVTGENGQREVVASFEGEGCIRRN